MKLEVTCPAKINTFLSVGPVDGAGYHPIRTIFQAVSLSDQLIMQRADEDVFVCNDESVPVENTVTRAWRLAKEYVELPKMQVTLDKNIPSMSGLGGGSSDAAGFLRGLIRMTKGRIGQKEAFEIACAVGADVPFFLVGGRAIGEGYGELLTPLPDLPRREIVIIKPDSGVSSGGAYAELDKHPRALAPIPEEPGFGSNDFESVAPTASQNLLQTLRELDVEFCSLSGSGSAVFAFIGDHSQSDFVFPGCKTYFAHTLTREESLWIS